MGPCLCMFRKSKSIVTVRVSTYSGTFIKVNVQSLFLKSISLSIFVCILGHGLTPREINGKQFQG